MQESGPSPTPERLTEFLTSVVGLSLQQFDDVRAAGRRLGPARRIQARKAAKLSTAEFSALDKRVRDAIQQRDAELNAVADGALSAAINDTLFAAHAVAYGSRLTAEQVAVLIGPFTSVGIAVPADQLSGQPQVSRHLQTAASAGAGTATDAAAATASEESRLAAFGRALFAKLVENPALNVIELPDGLGVCLVHATRGGGKIYVGPDETVLFVGSAVAFEEGLGTFRDGARTPLETFDHATTSDRARRADPATEKPDPA